MSDIFKKEVCERCGATIYMSTCEFCGKHYMKTRISDKCKNLECRRKRRQRTWKKYYEKTIKNKIK